MSKRLDTLFGIAERLPPDRRPLFCAAVAELLMPYFVRFAGDGPPAQRLLRLLDEAWAGVADYDVGSPEALAAHDVPAAETGDHGERVAQSASIAVLVAAGAARGAAPEAVRHACDELELVEQVLIEGEDDEAAYSRGLVALRGLPPDEVIRGVEALNRPGGTGAGRRRVERVLREFTRAVKGLANPRTPASAPALRDAVKAIARGWD